MAAVQNLHKTFIPRFPHLSGYMASLRRARKQPETCWWHTACLAVCHHAVGLLVRPNPVLAMYPYGRRRSEAASTVHHHHWTSGPHGRAECTECLPTISMGWAGPSPAPSFALISPATITHDVCRRLVGAPGALSRASRRHASDTHDVAIGAGRDGRAGGMIGIVLQHVEYRPPCDLAHRARRAAR